MGKVMPWAPIGIKQRKCGADFVYLSEGCGKTQAKINDTQYPTLE